MKNNAQFRDDQEREEWFLAALAADPPPMGRLMEVLSSLHSSGKEELADSWVELLQEELRSRNNIRAGIDILALRADWHDNNPDFRRVCRETVLEILRRDGTGPDFVRAVGMDKDVSPVAALRRLQILTQLAPDVLCYDKTWGFGVVKRVDGFYSKVLIDFAEKPNHEMSFEYATSSLQLLDDEHILAINHRDPQQLANLAKSHPAALVKLAIRSYGPMNAVRLQELLLAAIVAEDDWKTFWSNARTALRSDPSVEFPRKRNDPIRLLATARTYDKDWFNGLRQERDLSRIVTMLEDLADHMDRLSLRKEFHDTVLRRVVFLISGAEQDRPDLVARSLVALHRLGIENELPDMEKYAQRYLAADMLLAATEKLPAKAMKPFMDYLFAFNENDVPQLLLDNLNDMHTTLFNESVDFLHAIDRRGECMEVLAHHVAKRNASAEMLYWLCRHSELTDNAISLDSLSEMIVQVLDRFEESAGKHRTKAKRQLRQLFEHKGWLAKALEGTTPEQKHNIIRRIRDSAAWSPDDKASVLAKLLVMDPSLNSALEAQTDEVLLPDSRPRLTSWRSYNQRRKELEKLETESIPRNAKELAQARSYGDLSENHAFKDAKEQQAILLSRRDAIAQELNQVKGTTFEHAPFDCAGPGTRVLLEQDDGTRQEYFILGDWDSDEELAIISCNSPLALALADHPPGSLVELPGEVGSATCRLVEVTPFPQKIKDWAKW